MNKRPILNKPYLLLQAADKRKNYSPCFTRSVLRSSSRPPHPEGKKMMMENTGFLRYWGKTNKSIENINPPYHLLAYHCLDVAACGYHIIKNNIFDSRNTLHKCGITGTDAENWII